MILYFGVISLLLLLLTLLLKPKKTTPQQPPSPAKLPILGNLHQLGSLPHRSLRALSQKHGPLMFIHFGSVPSLVVSSEDSAREILKTHDPVFSDRPTSIVTDELFYRGKDIAFAPYGEYWRQIRKVSVIHLLSTKRVESFRAVREEEVSLMIENISKSSGSPINLGELLISTTNNIVSRVAFGKKYYEEKKGSDIGFHQLLADFIILLGTPHIGDIFPSLAWIGRLTGLDAKLKKNSKEWDDFLEKVIEEHLEPAKSAANGGREDFVDVLLDTEKNGELGFSLGRDGIKAILLDNFAAGSDTTYTAMVWAMAELIEHPRVMKKVQEEIRKAVQGKYQVTEVDVEGMHYLKAVIKETFRLHPPLPLLVSRKSTQDVQLQGYHIPARTRVIVNAWAIGRDPKSWKDPEEYWPERFIMHSRNSSAIDFRGHDFQLIPFGAGRRGCPGIAFTVPTLELALANLLYRFDWELSGGIGEEVDMAETFGITTHMRSPLLLVAKDHLQH